MSPQPRGTSRVIDWAALRGRLELLSTRIESAGQLSPEREASILRERANVLARIEQAGSSERLCDNVVFERGGLRWALAPQWILEVVRVEKIAPLPGSPPGILGMFNLRGDLLLCADLAVLLQVSAQAPVFYGLVVVGREQPEIAFVIDAVPSHELLPEPRGQPHTLSSDLAREIVRGIDTEGRLRLDGEALLSSDKLFLDQRD